jgi:hypothetical protein
MQKDQANPKVEWWKDKVFTDELDKEFDAWKRGKVKAYTMPEIRASIATLKRTRKVK